MFLKTVLKRKSNNSKTNTISQNRALWHALVIPALVGKDRRISDALEKLVNKQAQVLVRDSEE